MYTSIKVGRVYTVQSRVESESSSASEQRADVPSVCFATARLDLIKDKIKPEMSRSNCVISRASGNPINVFCRVANQTLLKALPGQFAWDLHR